MSQFNNMRLTTAGSSLLQQVHQGVELQLTKIVLGAGAWTDAQQAGTPPAALVDQRLSVSISSIDQSGSTAVVRGTATNSGLASGEGFSITEVGVIAEHPTAGEILYMADYVSSDKASYLSEATGIVIEIPLKIYIRCVTGSTVTIQIDDRFVSASLDDIDTHDAASDAHPGLRVQSPTLYFVGADEIDEGGQTVIGAQGYVTGDWDIEAVVEVKDAGGDVVTDDFTPAWDAALGRIILTAPEVAADGTYSIRAQLWEHGLIRSQDWSNTLTLTVGDVPINQPTITSPADGATGVGETPTITSSAFSADGDQTHAASQFQVATTASFTSPVVDSSEDAANLTSYTVAGALSADQLYYVRARHLGSDGNWSPWSAAVSFFTADSFIYVSQPSISSPATGATDIGETPEIAASAYATNGTGNHLNTDWQVQAAGGDWSNPVWESLADAVHLESVTVPAGVLVVSTQYEVRCRYHDDSDPAIESEWSGARGFTTAISFLASSIWAAWDEMAEATLATQNIFIALFENPNSGGNEVGMGGPPHWDPADRTLIQTGNVPGAIGTPPSRACLQSQYFTSTTIVADMLTGVRFSAMNKITIIPTKTNGWLCSYVASSVSADINANGSWYLSGNYISTLAPTGQPVWFFLGYNNGVVYLGWSTARPLTWAGIPANQKITVNIQDFSIAQISNIGAAGVNAGANWHYLVCSSDMLLSDL